MSRSVFANSLSRVFPPRTQLRPRTYDLVYVWYNGGHESITARPAGGVLQMRRGRLRQSNALDRSGRVASYDRPKDVASGHVSEGGSGRCPARLLQHHDGRARPGVRDSPTPSTARAHEPSHGTQSAASRVRTDAIALFSRSHDAGRALCSRGPGSTHVGARNTPPVSPRQLTRKTAWRLWLLLLVVVMLVLGS